MPEFLPPTSASFALDEGVPSIRLDLDVPQGAAAGPWGLLSRATLCVIDGPGDLGYLLPRMAAGPDPAPDGWDEAVERAGGCWVVFGRSPGVPPTFAGSLG